VANKKKKKKDIGVEITPSSPQHPAPTTGVHSFESSAHYREYLKRIYKRELQRRGLKET